MGWAPWSGAPPGWAWSGGADWSGGGLPGAAWSGGGLPGADWSGGGPPGAGWPGAAPGGGGAAPGGVADPPGSVLPLGGHGEVVPDPGTPVPGLAPALGPVPVPGPAPALGSGPKVGLPPVLGLPVLGLPVLGLPVLGLPVLGLPPALGPAGCPVVPPDPLCLAAAVVIGAKVVPLAGAGCDGAPKPDDGAVVVVVAPPGHEFEPEPAHCADGAVVVVVVVDFLVFFGVGHLAGGVGEGELGPAPADGPVVVVVDDEPDLPFDFLAVVVAAGAAGAAAAARWSSVWGTAELPATAGVRPPSTAATTVAAANPRRPMRMRDIGTSLFHLGGRRSGLDARPPAALGTPQGTF